MKSRHVLWILASHLFPLFGLFALGWSPFQTIFVFCAETLIMTFFFEAELCLRIFVGRQWSRIPASAIIFPVLIFSAIQIIIATLMFGTGNPTIGNSITWGNISAIVNDAILVGWLGIFLMFLRHAMLYVKFIRAGKFRDRQPIHTETFSSELQNDIGLLMARIFILQVTVIFGGFVSKVSGSAAFGVTVLVLLQLAHAIYSYRKISLKPEEIRPEIAPSLDVSAVPYDPEPSVQRDPRTLESD